MLCAQSPTLSLLLTLPMFGASDAVELALPTDASIELEATWETLTDSVYGFTDRYPLIRELRPAVARADYDTQAFRPFLPPAPVEVGDVWRVDAKDALPFLEQLHPGARAELHHGRMGDRVLPGIAAEGAWACLRAVGPRHAEILLRVHADFLLDGDGGPGSAWFTPAQFEGRLVLDRTRGVVASFELGVPDQSANVDVNMPHAQGVAADIGRVPRMEVRGGAVSELELTAQIDDDEARARLARRFYPLAEVDWLELADALAASRREAKPLHVVLLFGSLTDESC